MSLQELFSFVRAGHMHAWKKPERRFYVHLHQVSEIFNVHTGWSSYNLVSAFLCFTCVTSVSPNGYHFSRQRKQYKLTPFLWLEGDTSRQSLLHSSLLPNFIALLFFVCIAFYMSLNLNKETGLQRKQIHKEINLRPPPSSCIDLAMSDSESKFTPRKSKGRKRDQEPP